MTPQDIAFRQPLVVPVKDPGLIFGRPRYRLVEEYTLWWMGRPVICEKDYEFDGASIPRPLWSLFGYIPFSLQLAAAAGHDKLCETQPHWCSSLDAAEFYRYYALLGGTRPCKAEVHYWAIRLFGPQWERKTPPSLVQGSLLA